MFGLKNYREYSEYFTGKIFVIHMMTACFNVIIIIVCIVLAGPAVRYETCFITHHLITDVSEAFNQVSYNSRAKA